MARVQCTPFAGSDDRQYIERAVLASVWNVQQPRAEEFAGARRVCWGSKSLLGPEEFAGARRVCWGPKSLLELEEFAGARRVCWGPKSLLGPEEFAGARRVCWGPKSLLGPEEFPGAQSRVWLEEFPGARKGNILIMDKEPFVKQLLFYSVHTRYNPAALYECVMQDLVKSMKANSRVSDFQYESHA
jgi:hypothetical protein